MSICVKLRQQREQVLNKMDAVLSLAGDRPTNADEDRLLATLQAEDDSLAAQIGKAEADAKRAADIKSRKETLSQSTGRLVGDPHAGRVELGKQRPLWSSFGEQLQAIVQAGSPDGNRDERLAVSGGSANVGSDGGYLIQKDFSAEIYKLAYETGQLAGRCRRVGISKNSDGLEIPFVEEDSRATGSRWGGVRVYRRAEADTVTASRPKIGKLEFRLEELMGIAYMTERLAQDASAMEDIYKQAFAEEFAFVLDDEIYRGSGVGQCQGLLTAAATIEVAKETSQPADTIVAENVQKMWARCHARHRFNAVWFVNQEIEPQLQGMQIGTGTSAHLVYMPAGGLSGAQYGTLFGRPVVPIEHASALGDKGDITLADLSQYMLIEKDSLRSDVSMHVRFLYDERCFRFIMRVNGGPLWKSAKTPYKGASTLSPFVTLASRA